MEGLFRRAGFSFEQPPSFFEHTVFNAWQFPLLIQYHVTYKRLRPFVNVGASLRHIAGIQTSFYGIPGLMTGNSSDILRNSGSWGGVAGAGLTFKKGLFELSPEIRYTRWVNQSFNAVGLTNSLDESVILLGVGF